MTAATFAEAGIRLPSSAQGGNVKTTCPECSAGRKKKSDPCLSVNIPEGVWRCHHCAWSGSLGKKERREVQPKDYRVPKPPKRGVSGNRLTWFADRGITEAVLTRNRIGEGKAMMPGGDSPEMAIQFPYLRGGHVVNVKYRTGDKRFRMEGGAELILYGLDDLRDQKTAFIVEGEMDALALEVAGFPNAVSVPNGAPGPNVSATEKRFAPFVSAQDLLDPLEQIILAVDNDAPGKKLETELARRLGKHRCWRVEWPEGCKDANDVLMKHGAEALADCLCAAKPYPLDDVLTVADISTDIDRLFAEGIPPGESTGWRTLDHLFTVSPGRLTTVTGIPSHGKSEFVEALLVRLSMALQWSHALFTPEHYPVALHALRLASKLTGKTVGNATWNGFEKMTAEGLEECKATLAKSFFWIEPREGEATLDGILERATGLVFRYGIRTLTIDPWNEIEHGRPDGLSETEYVSQCLSRLKRWSRKHDVHVFLIAHPTKLQRKQDGKYPVPTPYDISGSAHFRNKADNCITIWRELNGPNSAQVEIHVQKVKWKSEGRIGVCGLEYEPATGRYRDSGRVL